MQVIHKEPASIEDLVASDELDVSKLEDLFFCIEVLSEARVALNDVSPMLASKLGRVTDSLMAFSDAAQGTRSCGRERDMVNLVDEEIIDVFTGEVINRPLN